MLLYNHLNSPVWSEKNQRKNLVNGAKRYSEVITEYYYPIFQEVLGDDPDTGVITVTTENHPIQFREFKRIFLPNCFKFILGKLFLSCRRRC